MPPYGSPMEDSPCPHGGQGEWPESGPVPRLRTISGFDGDVRDRVLWGEPKDVPGAYLASVLAAD